MHHGQSMVRRTLASGDLQLPGLATAAGSSGALMPAGEPLLTGRMREFSLRPGLSLYASDVCDQLDLDVSTPLPPGLLLVMALSGQADVSYGERRFQLGPQGSDEAPTHEGLAITLTRPDAFVRRLRAGARRRVVSLALTPEWLDESHGGLDCYPRIDAFRKTHLAVQRWRLSPRLLALAGDIVEARVPPSPLQSLYLESRCLEIAAEALTAIAGDMPAAEAGLRPRERRRLASLREFLDSGEGDGLSLGELARRIGMSTSSLQRNFRAFAGTSVFDYQRRRRLQAARAALERDGISVGEAAHRAGYTSAANFATAFRREFGLSPGQLRTRI